MFVLIRAVHLVGVINGVLWALYFVGNSFASVTLGVFEGDRKLLLVFSQFFPTYGMSE
jgi:hypothetical protein